MFLRFSFLAVLSIFARPAMGAALNLTDFRACVDSSGGSYGSTCQLASGVWDVDSTINVTRSVNIVGTVNDASDVVLRRTSTLGNNAIMFGGTDPTFGAISVTVEWLTFDGNRPNTVLCYDQANGGVIELSMSLVGVATVQNVNFVRAKMDSLWLGGSLQGSGYASTVTYSNFGQGLINSNNGYSLNGPQSAARYNDAVLYTDETGAWYNHIAYSGSAAINVWQGYLMYVIANDIFSSRYELGGVSGGLVYINDQATYASVANNLIDGNNWDASTAQQSNPSGANYTLCAPNNVNDNHNTGIEAFGLGHHYYNNQIQYNLGYGMLLRDTAGSTHHSMDNTFVSGYDPFCAANYPPGCTYVAHYLYHNATCGTNCYSAGLGFPASMYVANLVINGENATSANNITLDHIRSEYSGRYGVNLHSLTGTPGFTDSQNGGTNYACMSNNTGGDLTTGSVDSGYASFTNSCP
jgi:hypothetical protein